jgi:hypothetical protein
MNAMRVPSGEATPIAGRFAAAGISVQVPALSSYRQ